MEAFDPTQLAEEIMKFLEKERKGMSVMNLMMLGKTGVGKSTLINNLFTEKLAITGVGRPVTQKIHQHKKEGYPLTVYDTPGLELGGENAAENLLKDVNSIIKKGYNSGDPNKAIHCILYCVSATSHRFEEQEIKFIKQFLDENKDNLIPVIIVITQAISDLDTKEMLESIKKEHLGINNIIPVLAEDYEISKKNIIPAHGLDKLSKCIYDVLGEAQKKTFSSIQKANLKLKTAKAQAIVVAASSAAAATGAVPIPIADSAVLIPEQAMMLAGITNVFGLSIEKSTIITIISATLGTAGTTIAGKNLVSLIKLIPGAGTVAGGVISGGVAAALTAALGEAYIGVMIAINKGEMSEKDLGTAKGKKFIADSFKKKLKMKRDSKGIAIK